ncbi:MAG: PEP-CTERM sorting domain-containing protein [Kiritimatiellaeota bacterium]|nr:PEP-CTERM sorting domain-containing protein [Kiritimatiellota bacterium]
MLHRQACAARGGLAPQHGGEMAVHRALDSRVLEVALGDGTVKTGDVANDASGNTTKLYINGKLDKSVSGYNSTSSGAATWIGAESYQGGRWDFGGTIDDVGVFNNATDAAGIALVNGLGRTGGIGLDQLSAAQTLWGGSVGGTATVGGATWEKKASGLGAALGDWSGSVAGGNAKIVLDGSGYGLQVIPEPSTLSLAGLILAGLMLRRRIRK